MRNKRGLSAIVVNLIIILLAFVAAGILWGVISGVVERGAGDVELGQDCMDIGFQIKKANCDEEYCNVTLERNAGGKETNGVKMVFSDNSKEESKTIKKEILMSELEIKTIKNISIEEIGFQPQKVKAHVYFVTEDGKSHTCDPGSNSYNLN